MKKNILIALTIKQLIYLGMHIGHLRENSLFLAAWMFYGWRDEIFVINMIKTFVAAKVCVRYLSKITAIRRTIWYITQNPVFSPILCRYAVICGECFNVYNWIPGTLSNIKKNIRLTFFITKIIKKKKVYI